LSALIAGSITGILVTFLQMVTTVPLIAQAELYEGRTQKQEADMSVSAKPSDHDHANRSPKAGFERTFYTGLTTTLVAVGYALLLGACLSLLPSINWRTGLALGVAGYVVFQLAPAFGLPPEPPGLPQADLGARQIWWLATVVATAAGLWAWFYARTHSKRIWVPIGLSLIALPHLVGAPQVTEGQVAVVPHEIVQRFIVAALFAAAIFWLVLGALQGYVLGKLIQSFPNASHPN
jgi:cobalt transporter subunit CbtA